MRSAPQPGGGRSPSGTLTKGSKMEIDINEALANAIRDGLREGIKSRLSAQYGNPLDKLISEAVASSESGFRKLLETSLAACVSDEEFRRQIAESVRAVLAKTLVKRFGGELEKQVNQLKSDPVTRARITVAIEEIVKERASS